MKRIQTSVSFVTRDCTTSRISKRFISLKDETFLNNGKYMSFFLISFLALILVSSNPHLSVFTKRHTSYKNSNQQRIYQSLRFSLFGSILFIPFCIYFVDNDNDQVLRSLFCIVVFFASGLCVSPRIKINQAEDIQISYFYISSVIYIQLNDNTRLNKSIFKQFATVLESTKNTDVTSIEIILPQSSLQYVYSYSTLIKTIRSSGYIYQSKTMPYYELLFYKMFTDIKIKEISTKLTLVRIY